VRKGEDVTRLVGEAVSELHDIESRLDSMEEMEPASADFTQALHAVEAALAEHLRREEEAIFPLALRVLGHEEAEEMSERHDAMARGHA
jgi:hemerythrin-like domain-containing protein